MAPFLLLGFIFAGLLHVYVPKGAFNKWFGKGNIKSVIYAALMGIPLPLCSCGVIPTGISIYKEGASKGSTVSFLISTPQTGMDSIMVTYSLLGLPFAIARPIIALITGVFGGWLTNKVETDDRTEILNESEEQNVPRSGSKMRQIWNYAFDEFLGDIADWLIIGLLLAGLIAVIIPEEFFETVYMKNEMLSMLIVLIASIPFYVCATGSVPIAAALLMKGLNPGAVLVFLMAGPATNMATMTVISKTLGKKTLFVYISALVLGSFVFGLLINRLFPLNFFTIQQLAKNHHSGQIWTWIEWISVLFLALVLSKYYIQKIMSFFRKRTGQSKVSTQSVKIEVSGMTCENCASRVESSLLQLSHVNESKADLKSGVVEVKGNELGIDELKASIEHAGYGFKNVVEK